MKKEGQDTFSIFHLVVLNSLLHGWTDKDAYNARAKILLLLLSTPAWQTFPLYSETAEAAYKVRGRVVLILI